MIPCILHGMREHAEQGQRHFVPAAGHDWLLPFYDPLVRLLGIASARRQLIEQAALEPGHRVLDLGCGTGSLVALLGRLHPDVEITGLDPDPKALARARRKLDRAGLGVALDEGFADDLPYADASFDRVLSSFVFHHLPSEAKPQALREVRRVLRPGGALHLLDFGGEGVHREGLLARSLHAADPLRENFEGRIPALMIEAGFREARECAHRRTLFGRIAFYRAA